MQVLEIIHRNKCSDETQHIRRCFYVKASDDHPGYCHLYSCHSDQELTSSRMREMIRNLADDIFPGARANNDLSTAVTFSQRMKPEFYHALHMDTDVVLCYKLIEWPFEANEWLSRERINNWPSPETIAEIIRDGCHLVPKPHPLSKQNYTEWRYSFSGAELALGWAFTDAQLFCYIVTKVFFKFEQLVHSESVLKTYYLKTTMYWFCEQLNEEEAGFLMF
ncbi:cyclic GMP-AMP synthase-like receptor 2 [Clytia hemisphaerica]